MPNTTPITLRSVAAIFGIISIAFGFNAMLNIEQALSFFELPYPSAPEQRLLVDTLSVVYGIRDVFMGIAICVVAYFGNKKASGWIVFSAGCVAGVDGAVCRFMVGKGEWVHWGYAPMLVVLGLGLLL